MEEEVKKVINAEKKDVKQKKVKNKYTEQGQKESSKKKKIIIIIACICVAMMLVLSTIFALLNTGNSNIINGISINGIDVSGLSKEEAKEKIENLTNEKINKEITVSYGEYEAKINPQAIELTYDVNSVIDEADKVGRSGGLIRNNYSILKNLILKKNFKVKYTINEEITKSTIEEIGANLPGILIQSSYYIEDNNLIITKGKSGLVVNTDELINRLNDNFSEIVKLDTDIEIPVENKQPDPIDVDKIHEEVYKEVKDAYYTKDPFAIYPEVDGVDFDVEEVKNLLEEDKDEYKIALKITKAKFTINQIGAEAFPDKLATFTTKYDVSNKDRTTNLKLAAGKINGTVLMPGDEFSYNKVVGERTIAAGYKEAKVYQAGEVVDGLGGGICQISSTLYNSVVMANLEVTVRRNHQFVTSYLGPGRDATVVYGSQDFKFKNSRQYPVKIELTVNNGIARATILGIKEDKEYDISFQTNTISTIPFATKYEDDATLAPGEEKVKQKGANGIVTETYKISKLNGAVVSRTLLSKDTYNAMQRIIKRGAVVEETPVVPPAPTENTTPDPNPNPVPQEEPKQEEPTPINEGQ